MKPEIPFAYSPAPAKKRLMKMVAWDLETTPITAGETPRPLYITAWGQSFIIHEALQSESDLARILKKEFLTKARLGTHYIAWNSNRFDSYFALFACLDSAEYEVIPIVAADRQLRGMKIVSIESGKSWSFWDGRSMTGLNVSLAEFVECFAPEFPKLKIDIEHFDATNKEHVAYAVRDSQALYFAMRAAELMFFELTGRTFSMTIGSSAIKFFQSRMPEGVACWPMHKDVENLMLNYAKRGGYVHVAAPWTGKMWQYDINQAYVAALRETDLPCGKAVTVYEWDAKCKGIYIGTLSRFEPAIVPVYVKSYPGGEAVRAYGKKVRTVLHSCEIETLREFGWKFEIERGVVWMESFRMLDLVRDLEFERTRCGPKTGQGRILKSLGCNIVGKTMETPQRFKYKLSHDSPATVAEKWFGSDTPSLYMMIQDSKYRRVHQKAQIGSTVMAYTRMVVYRAAMTNPKAFIKADTDSVAFSCPVQLELSPTEYGKWKVEVLGEPSVVIAPKVWGTESQVAAKGFQNLTYRDLQAWAAGQPPSQDQIQLTSWYRMLEGRAMFRKIRRAGGLTDSN